MKYFFLALLLFAAGVAVMQLDRDQERYTPVVRLRTTPGLFVTFVQPGIQTLSECMRTVEAFTASLDTSCANCVLESADCQEKLEGIDRALASNEEVPFHTVEAKPFRVSVAGPPGTVLTQCREIASQMARAGLQGSVCREPHAKFNEQGGMR
jgi:hypothetical protein